MRMTLAALGAAVTLLAVAPAGAAPLITAPGAIVPDTEIITVQRPVRVIRPGAPVVRGGPRVVRGGPVVRGGRGRGGAVAAGVAAGVIGGLLVGGAAQQRYAEPEPDVVVVRRRRPVVVEDEGPVYVQRRRDCTSFSSYDPRTGTFIDRDGIERRCR
jgi:hypothetical protein